MYRALPPAVFGAGHTQGLSALCGFHVSAFGQEAWGKRERGEEEDGEGRRKVVLAHRGGYHSPSSAHRAPAEVMLEGDRSLGRLGGSCPLAEPSAREGSQGPSCSALSTRGRGDQDQSKTVAAELAAGLTGPRAKAHGIQVC